MQKQGQGQYVKKQGEKAFQTKFSLLHIPSGPMCVAWSEPVVSAHSLWLTRLQMMACTTHMRPLIVCVCFSLGSTGVCFAQA